MEISQNQINDKVIEVCPAGRIDASTVSLFEEAVLDLPQSGLSGILINLSDLEYISSAGLRGILKLAKAAKAEGVKLALCGLSKPVAEVFKISGFNMILKICDDRDAAVAEVA